MNECVHIINCMALGFKKGKNHTHETHTHIRERDRFGLLFIVSRCSLCVHIHNVVVEYMLHVLYSNAVSESHACNARYLLRQPSIVYTIHM